VGHGRDVEGAATHGARRLTRIAVMLLRYESLMQTSSCSGMQGAIPPAVAEVLSQHFGSCHECFASPLNHHCGAWGYDVKRSSPQVEIAAWCAL
jgi:hypothetical protein